MSVSANKKKSKNHRQEEIDLPVAPMIDVVFLLLIYFMVSATIQRQEADISFTLPGVVQLEKPLEIPEEQVVQVLANGQAIVNDFPYDSPKSPRYDELAGMLSRYKQGSDASLLEAKIVIAPANQAQHQSIVKVMDACSRAGIESVSFASLE